MVAYDHVGRRARVRGIGLVPETRKVIECKGQRAADLLDAIETNEAFSTQVCKLKKEIDLDPSKVNPNG
ncbi:hypothetical protein [Georgfuchsia toluolica]|uniref:hypothetical protein n=1 Tax=Georgfuchsia toluolica TaxID=424218 RepID=UPI003CCECBC3